MLKERTLKSFSLPKGNAENQSQIKQAQQILSNFSEKYSLLSDLKQP